MARVRRSGLSASRKKEPWDRWKAGEAISLVARALKKKPGGSIHGVLKAAGGVAPPEWHGARGALKKELLAHLRRGRKMRRCSRKASTASGQQRGRIKDAVSIRERPPKSEDRAVPGHRPGTGKET